MFNILWGYIDKCMIQMVSNWHDALPVFMLQLNIWWPIYTCICDTPVTHCYLPVTQDCWKLCWHGPRTRWWGWKHWPADPTEDARSVNGKRTKRCIIQIKLDARSVKGKRTKHCIIQIKLNARSVNGKRTNRCIIQIKLDTILLFLGFNH